MTIVALTATCPCLQHAPLTELDAMFDAADQARAIAERIGDDRATDRALARIDAIAAEAHARYRAWAGPLPFASLVKMMDADCGGALPATPPATAFGAVLNGKQRA